MNISAFLKQYESRREIASSGEYHPDANINYIKECFAANDIEYSRENIESIRRIIREKIILQEKIWTPKAIAPLWTFLVFILALLVNLSFDAFYHDFLEFIIFNFIFVLILSVLSKYIFSLRKRNFRMSLEHFGMRLVDDYDIMNYFLDDLDNCLIFDQAIE